MVHKQRAAPLKSIATGTKTYSQAIGDVIDEMTSSGIRTVDYASGKSERIEVAARRAVMTGMAQMTDKVNEKNAEKLQTDYFEVDWHMGARNTGSGYQNHKSRTARRMRKRPTVDANMILMGLCSIRGSSSVPYASRSRTQSF